MSVFNRLHPLHCRTRTFQFNLPPLPKRFVSKELISLNAFLKRKPSLIIRRMLAIDGGDTYLAPRADVQKSAIEFESDDDATLVAGMQVPPPSAKELERYTKVANTGQVVSVILGKKICDNLPDCSDGDEFDDDDAWEDLNHDEPVAETASGGLIIETPPPPSPPPINYWSPRNEIFDAPGFEIVKEDDRIVYATTLCPPPWHRPKENMLACEPATSSDDDELHLRTRCSSGEYVRAFSW